MQRFFLILSIILFPGLLLAEGNIPARCTADRVNVRVRPVLGSEIVCQISKNETVDAIEKGDTWTKINAPFNSRCWVKKDYIKDNVVRVSKVNFRCGPGIAFPVLGSVTKGAKLDIIKKSGDWVRIKPPVKFPVWVSSQYIEYLEKKQPSAKKSAPKAKAVNKLSEILVKEIKPAPILSNQYKNKKESGKRNILARITVQPDKMLMHNALTHVELVSYAGLLQDMGVIINRPGTYKITLSGKWICLLKSPNLNLNPYVNHIVRIEGVVVAIAGTWDVPVVEVKRLQLIK